MVEVLERHNMWKLEFQPALNNTDEKACNENNYVRKNNAKQKQPGAVKKGRGQAK